MGQLRPYGNQRLSFLMGNSCTGQPGPDENERTITLNGNRRAEETPVEFDPNEKLITIMVEASEINWEEINEKLPYERNDEALEKRRELFKQFDPNGNGYLSLAEVDKGMRDVLACDELFDCKQAVNRAFHFAKNYKPPGAKNVSKKEDKYGPEYLEFREFRVFLQTLRQFFEYYQAFARIDTGDDNRVSKEEFTGENIKPIIEKWVGEIEDMDAEFDAIDKNGGGQILFSEFVDWALEKNLDLEDDVDE